MIADIFYSYDQEEVTIFGLGPVSQNNLASVLEKAQVMSSAP